MLDSDDVGAAVSTLDLGRLSRGTPEAFARTPSVAGAKDSYRSGSTLAAPISLAAVVTSLLRGRTWSVVAVLPLRDNWEAYYCI